mgnify:CR=1 FL=1
MWCRSDKRTRTLVFITITYVLFLPYCFPFFPLFLSHNTQNAICVGNHTVLLVQFGINLHEWVFQKAEIARAASAIQTWKKSNGKSAARCFLSLFLCIRENFFQSFCTNVLSLLYMGSLDFYKSSSRITMCNLHWCYTFCTGVTLELHCSQPIRIEKFFHVYYYQSSMIYIFISAGPDERYPHSLSSLIPFRTAPQVSVTWFV